MVLMGKWENGGLFQKGDGGKYRRRKKQGEQQGRGDLLGEVGKRSIFR